MLAGVTAYADELAAAVSEFRVERHLRVITHPPEQIRIVAGVDPALHGRERNALASPVVKGPQADVVPGIQVPVVDREVGEVQQRQESIWRETLVVGRGELSGILEEHLGAIGLGISGGLDEMEVGRNHQQLGRGLVRDGVANHRVRLGPKRQPVLGLGRPSLVLGVVGRPLVERDDALAGRLDELLAEFDRLGQDDLFLGAQEGDPSDLSEVHPNRVVDADHVGRECLELLDSRLLELPRLEPGLLEVGPVSTASASDEGDLEEHLVGWILGHRDPPADRARKRTGPHPVESRRSARPQRTESNLSLRYTFGGGIQRWAPPSQERPQPHGLRLHLRTAISGW